MEIGTILATTGAVATGNYVVWGLKPGEYFYNATKFSGKTYDTYLRPAIEKILGLRRKEITPERLPKIDGKTVYRFKDVSPINLENIKLRSLLSSLEKVDLSIREESLNEKKRAEIAETTATKKVPLEDKPTAEEPTPPSQKSSLDEEAIHYFDVELTEKSDTISLGDIHDPNWSLKDYFDISITKKGGIAYIGKESEDYKQVVTTLERSLQISQDLPLISDKKVHDEMVEAIGGSKIIDFWNDLAPTLRGIPQTGTNYIDTLVKLAIDPTKTIDSAQIAINNYYSNIEKLMTNEINLAEKTQQILEKEAQIRKNKTNIIKNKAALISKTAVSSAGGPLIIGTALGIAAISIAGTIVLAALLPEAAVVVTIIKGALTALLTYASNNIFSGLVGTGTLSIIGGIFTKGIREYKLKKSAAKEVDDELNTTITTKESLEHDLENLTSLKDGAIKTLETIKDFASQKNQNITLDLTDKKIGDMGIVVACNYASKTNLVRELKLSNNGITSIGAKELANAIKNMQTSLAPTSDSYLTTIDLTKNDIDAAGINALTKAMKNSFTVVELKYDSIKDPDDNEIYRQSIINQYLQGIRTYDELQSTIPLPTEFLAGEQALKKAAIEKLNINFDQIDFPAIKDTGSNVELSLLVRKIKNQNIHLQKLSNELLNPSTTIEKTLKIIGEDGTAAFNHDPKRCAGFIKERFAEKLLTEKRNEIDLRNDVSPKQKIAALYVLDLALGKKPLPAGSAASPTNTKAIIQKLGHGEEPPNLPQKTKNKTIIEAKKSPVNPSQDEKSSPIPRVI